MTIVLWFGVRQSREAEEVVSAYGIGKMNLREIGEVFWYFGTKIVGLGMLSGLEN